MKIRPCLRLKPKTVRHFRLSSILLGSALVCYHCMLNKRNTSVNTTSAGPTRSSSCSPKPGTCASDNETYCLSMRLSQSAERIEQIYKTCANKDKCLAAHYACVHLKNTTKPNGTECVALCCEANLCNLHHGNAVLNTVPSHLLLFIVTMVTLFV